MILKFQNTPGKECELLLEKYSATGIMKNPQGHSNYKKYGYSEENLILANEWDKNWYDTVIEEKMHPFVIECVRDFLNLVFSSAKETDDFWEQVLIPQACEKFSFSVAKLMKEKVNLNALLFAFIYHFGLEIDINEATELGKVEIPFAKNQIKELQAKTKVFGLRNIPYKVLAERFKEYRKRGKVELSLKVKKLKSVIIF
jgi:hypothetical protein